MSITAAGRAVEEREEVVESASIGEVNYRL